MDAQDQAEPLMDNSLVDQPESLPSGMYTIPASERNYEYEGTSL